VAVAGVPRYPLAVNVKVDVSVCDMPEKAPNPKRQRTETPVALKFMQILQIQSPNAPWISDNAI
jgi:hypothetical protein